MERSLSESSLDTTCSNCGSDVESRDNLLDQTEEAKETSKQSSEEILSEQIKRRPQYDISWYNNLQSQQIAHFMAMEDKQKKLADPRGQMAFTELYNTHITSLSLHMSTQAQVNETQSDRYVMLSQLTAPCTIDKKLHPHSYRTCWCYENALYRRRAPLVPQQDGQNAYMVLRYRGTLCVFQGKHHDQKCPKGSHCDMCCNTSELQYHPWNYKQGKCFQKQQGLCRESNGISLCHYSHDAIRTDNQRWFQMVKVNQDYDSDLIQSVRYFLSHTIV